MADEGHGTDYPALAGPHRHGGCLAWIVAGGLGLLAASAANAGRPLLVWNASASMPPGLYALIPGVAGKGDYVVAWPPAHAATLAARRGYLPHGVPLVKTVRGGSGDRVCASGARLSINGQIVALRRSRDRLGRPLPRWSGCTVLGPDRVLLLGSGEAASFDGRYFGPSPIGQVIGRATLLWPS